MARKSRQRRLTETTALYEGYTAAGLAESYHGRFIRDMKLRLERGKGLYPKQRNWLDDLIEGGVPAPKGDPAAIAKIDAAIAGWAGNVERSWESGVLSDFRHKFVNGWDLSEKQAALLEKMLQRDEDDVTGANVYTPSDDFADAARKAAGAIEEFRIEGVETNLGFLGNVLTHEEFVRDEVYTRWVDDNVAELTAVVATAETPAGSDEGLAGAQLDTLDPLAGLNYFREGGGTREAQLAAAVAPGTQPAPQIVGPPNTEPLRSPVQGTIVELTVAEGDAVREGQQIAVIRQANPAFLHFEVRKGVDSVDPVSFLQ